MTPEPSDPAGPVRITRRVAPWFEAAFRSHALGERLTWEIVFAINPQVGPHLVLYSEIPAGVLGSVHVDVTQVRTIGLSQPMADRVVCEVIERLLQLRSRALATNGAPVAGLLP